MTISRRSFLSAVLVFPFCSPLLAAEPPTKAAPRVPKLDRVSMRRMLFYIEKEIRKIYRNACYIQDDSAYNLELNKIHPFMADIMEQSDLFRSYCISRNFNRTGMEMTLFPNKGEKITIELKVEGGFFYAPYVPLTQPPVSL